MKLLGVDIGFSKERRSTAVACLDGDKLDVWLARTDPESRICNIPDGFRASVVALDGPLLPSSSERTVQRLCEEAFVRAPFHNRCKPGLSHWGFGLNLRDATAIAYSQFSPFVEISEKGSPSVTEPDRVIEAFPNAFLGVLTPEATLRLRRFSSAEDDSIGCMTQRLAPAT